MAWMCFFIIRSMTNIITEWWVELKLLRAHRDNAALASPDAFELGRLRGQRLILHRQKSITKPIFPHKELYPEEEREVSLIVSTLPHSWPK